jgi:uncharacterized protein DUF4150
MAATVDVDGRTVVHRTSEGVATAFPDVCLTPPAPVPVPYPNVALSSDADAASCARTLVVDGNPLMLKSSVFATSTGDEPGSAGGVVSGTFKGKAEFVSYSFDVIVEGRNVPRLGDLMVQNELTAPNTPPFPEVQPPQSGDAGEIVGDDNELLAIDFVE